MERSRWNVNAYFTSLNVMGVGWYYYEHPDGWYLVGDGMADLKPADQGALLMTMRNESCLTY